MSSHKSFSVSSSQSQPKINHARGSSHPSSVFNMAPKKVIRAIQQYKARMAGELSFERGDFFYVINEPDGDTYEVMNPIQRVRGKVPSSLFQSLDQAANEIDAEKETSKRISEVGMHWYEMLVSASIPKVETKPDGLAFTIELKLNDGSSDILFRTYEDFYILHCAVLANYPKESGRKSEPRSIPFLAKPIRNMSDSQSQSLRLVLHTYLQELVLLPTIILASPHSRRFFNRKATDMHTHIKINFDNGDTLMDLLEDMSIISKQPRYFVTVHNNRGDNVTWEDDPSLTYDALLDEAEHRFGTQVDMLDYQDECGELVPLHNDKDLGLLLRTNRDNLVFYLVD